MTDRQITRPGSRPAPEGTIYTIAGSDSFAALLAAGIKADYSVAGDPLALSRVTLLVPTRRAVAAMIKAFGDLDPGGVVLMPQIVPLGDIGEDDLEAGASLEDMRADVLPAIAPLQRQLLLTRLVMGRGAGQSDVAGSVASAAMLASDLARFFDGAATEEVDLSGLGDIVPETLAEHWQKTLDFLKIVTDFWPAILAEKNVMDPARRRALVLHQLADKWAKTEPSGPVIIAGSTGSIPATQNLMASVLAHESGVLVLPGLDVELKERVWQRVGPTHPQFGLKTLLDGLGVSRGDVKVWPRGTPDVAALEARRAVLSMAMLPADTTEGWLAFSQQDDVRGALGAAFARFARIECDDPRHEALTIALVMRQTLEHKGRTAALVTPDRGLARRVSVELRRWGLEVDDSAGVPLTGTPVGSFLALVLEVVQSGFAPVPLLGLLKHPLTGLGLPRPALRVLAARFEMTCLRGVRPARGLEGLRQRLEAQRIAKGDRVKDAGLDDLLARLEAAFLPLLTIDEEGPHAIAHAHAQVGEALATTGEAPGAQRLWAGEAGETAMVFFSDLLAEIETLDVLTFDDYPALFGALIRPLTVRHGRAAHPRAFIWGPLEARLQSADRIILGGLNEKVWPQAASMDPWLSRPMRAALGLSEPERRIGQSAHDFVQLAGARDVVVTRALKVDGAPSVASRWLMRLENMLAGLEASDLLEGAHLWAEWARALDVPDELAPVQAPRPAPPLSVRPRSLSVTEIETWLRDPYAIYAKHILGLKVLEPLDASPGPATRGNAVHRALERFVKAHKEGVSDADLGALIEEGRKAFAEEGTQGDVLAFWLPRFERLARWFIGFEKDQRTKARPLALEVSGHMIFDGPAGPFELKARADRIDIGSDGRAGIYDYKTGQVPTAKQIKALLAPQLPLEAMMVQAGGFEGVGKPQVFEIAHVQLSGAKVPGKVIRHDTELDELIARVGERLEEYIGIFDQPEHPYLSRVVPLFEGRAGLYDHLARVREWSVYGSEEEAGS